MPIRYSTDPVNRRLVTRADGVVTFDEINAHLDVEQRNRDLDRPELAEGVGAASEVIRDVESATRWLNRVSAERD